ncbi:hypothetical protein [Halomonas sp. AOP42-D1-22]|uniref:hypothetical protein n=1 Tax=Halomonas sp. AOP42-D1-22 TaxID=3457667 RepID=UPI004034D57A
MSARPLYTVLLETALALLPPTTQGIFVAGMITVWQGIIDGQPAFFSFVETPGESDAQISIGTSAPEGSKAPAGDLCRFWVPAAACSDEWRQQFWADYQANPAFRAAVGSFYRLDEPPEGPDYGDAIGIALEAQSDVPIAISRSIEELQDLDVYIAEAHAGSTLRPPYLRSTTPIPGPLLALLKEAGFVVSALQVSIDCSRAHPHLLLAASAAFTISLENWRTGHIVPHHWYRDLWRPQIMPSPLIPLTTDDEQTFKARWLERQLAWAASKLAWGGISEGDLHKLHSGRDAFSRLKHDDLLNHLSLTAKPSPLSEWEEVYQLRILRWMCRGAPLTLAMHKVATEAAFEGKARERSQSG